MFRRLAPLVALAVLPGLLAACGEQGAGSKEEEGPSGVKV
jgi:hypothetical protein